MEQDSLNFNLKLLAKSSFIVFIGLFLSKVFTYLYRIIMARYFGPEIYGVFSLAIMIFGIFVSFSLLGLSEGLSRYIPFYRGKNKKKEISYVFHFASYLSLFSSIFFGIVLYLSSKYISINLFHSEELIIFLRIFSFLIPINVLANLFLVSIKSFEKIKIYSFSVNFLPSFFKVIFLILLLHFGFKTDSVPFSYFAGIFIMFLFSFFYCKYKLSSLFINSEIIPKDKKIIKLDLLKYSIPLMFYGFISMIFYWADSFFIGYYKTPFEVGIYNASIPIALLLIFVPELFTQLFFPLINKEYSKKNLLLIKELSKQVGKWIFLINLPLFLLMFLFPEFILNILFGAEYLQAQTALKILIFGQLFFSVSLISLHLVLMKGKSNVILLDIFLISILNIFLNYLLVPMESIFFIDNSLGMNGAAISTTISIIFLNFLFIFQSKKYLSIIPLRKKMINISVSAIIPLFFLILIKRFIQESLISFVTLSLFFLLVYLLLLFLLKGLDKNDLMIIKTIKKNLTNNNL
jgi:O-antigen/teichoic acid export membrane protein